LVLVTTSIGLFSVYIHCTGWFAGTSVMATCWLKYSHGIFLKTSRCTTTTLEIHCSQSSSTGWYWNLWVQCAVSCYPTYRSLQVCKIPIDGQVVYSQLP